VAPLAARQITGLLALPRISEPSDATVTLSGSELRIGDDDELGLGRRGYGRQSQYCGQARIRRVIAVPQLAA
jgi:hypothetical protein